MVSALQRAGAAVVGELVGEMAMGDIVLGGHHDAAGILVEPVNDAGALDAADAGKACAAMVDQRVDQRTGPVAGARMNDEARRAWRCTIRSSSS
jgi:hypothetical protein